MTKQASFWQTNRKRIIRLSVVALLIGAFAAYIMLDADGQLLHVLQSSFSTINAYYEQNRLLIILSFFALYTVINATMIPGSLPLMLLAGALFGFPLGLALCVSAGTIGSVIAFTLIRRFFYESLRKRYEKLTRFTDEQIKRNGIIYLLVLRVSPGIPTNLISITMGLTSVPLWKFALTTFVGVMPWYGIYVSAGQMLMEIKSLSDIVSGNMIAWSAGIAVMLIGIVLLREKFGIGKSFNEAAR